MDPNQEPGEVVARPPYRAWWWLLPIGLVLAALFTFGTGLTSCDIHFDDAEFSVALACIGFDPPLSKGGPATTYPKGFTRLSFVTSSAKLAHDAAQENTKYRPVARAFDTLVTARRHGRQADIVVATRKARQACAPFLPDPS